MIWPNSMWVANWMPCWRGLETTGINMGVKVKEYNEHVTFGIDQIRLNRATFTTLAERKNPPQTQLETKAHISNETVSLENDRHLVSLIVNVKRMEGKEEIFDCEVCYTGVFLIRGLSEEKGHELLMTRCLDTLYPYVSSTIAQLANMAGFQDLQMVPISFGALYRSEQREKQQWEHIQDKVVRH